MYCFLKLLLLFEKGDLHVGVYVPQHTHEGQRRSSQIYAVQLVASTETDHWPTGSAFRAVCSDVHFFSSLCMWVLSPCWVNLITFSSRTGCLPYGNCSFVGQKPVWSVTIVLWATGVLLRQSLPMPMSPCVSLCHFKVYRHKSSS